MSKLAMPTPELTAAIGRMLGYDERQMGGGAPGHHRDRRQRAADGDRAALVVSGDTSTSVVEQVAANDPTIEVVQLPAVPPERIDRIPGARGWQAWHNRDVFAELAQQLRDRGFSVGQALDLLSRAYSAVADDADEYYQDGT